uniref:protein-histidine N-methyltransferase n=1 Tax=Aceria tosichella TaxID=561515 RepID=A0A6G1SGA0_9ACAR
MLNNNNLNHGRTNGPPSARQKTARRQLLKEDHRRSDLLAKILEESSSITLNDPTSQLSARQAIENHSRLFDLIAELRDVECKLNPTLPTRDEESWSQFIKWFSDKELEVACNVKDDGKSGEGGRLFDKVGIKLQMGTRAMNHYTDEYSLLAKVPFKKGDKVFEIDRRLMLTTETALKDSDLYDFVRKDSIASGMQNVVLVLHLLNEYSKREQSQWWPYLSILPSKILPVLYMNKEQITNYLIASAHLHTALKMLRAITRQYAYFYKRLQSTKLPLRHNFTFLFYAWGVSMVCSRQNEIPHSRHRYSNKNHHDHKDDEPCSSSVHALIPVLDMCNHNRYSNQATFENDTSCLLAASDLLHNEEITINYGCRSSGDFYIHNGFVPDDVPFDMVGFTIALNQKQDPLFEQKAKILKTLNMPMTFGEFTLRSNDYENRHRRDPHLTMFLIVNFLQENEINYMLASENPVAVADEIYDYVQYESCNLSKRNQDETIQEETTVNHDNVAKSEIAAANGAVNGREDRGPVDEMKKRILGCIREYLSRRASISIALLDRTLKSLEERSKDSEFDEEIRLSTMKLLQHERKIYESHVLKL